MKREEGHMRRCLELAELGGSAVAPNPRVGCVIVSGDTVLSEGYHRKFGADHAEVVALNAVSDRNRLSNATLYVNLEPCPHTGKTPPCCKRIVEEGIPRVVIGCLDPSSSVHGAGVEYLKNHGVTVQCGVLERACRFANRRFETFHCMERPYVMLKWAQTEDGFLAKKDFESKWISGEASRARVHLWREQESSILVGTNTAIHDNPSLTARPQQFEPDQSAPENQPIRIVLDRTGRIPPSHQLFDGSALTLIISEDSNLDRPNAETIPLSFSEDFIPALLQVLHSKGILSVLVEGGAQTLQSFFDADAWDEIRAFKGQKRFEDGIPAPSTGLLPDDEERIQSDILFTYWRPELAELVGDS